MEQNQIMLKGPQDISILHFIGVGGIGMSGIAEVLHGSGYKVQGSDLAENDNIERLRRQGISVFIGHKADHIENHPIDVVVVSSDIKADNIELLTARSQGIPIIKRAEMLAELMRLRPSIAVAGTHGKTSTTSLAAGVLMAGDCDPTIVNGGIIHDLDSNARVGKGWTLVEADESDGSFLKLPATIGIVTNIDPDHLENYDSFNHLRQSFVTFIKNLPFYGLGIVCLDHPEIQALLPQLQDRRVMTYGTNENADIRADHIRLHGDNSVFDVTLSQKAQHFFGLKGNFKDIRLSMIGHHNVLNSLSVMTMALELKIPEHAWRQGLETFKGVGRRFTQTGNVRGIRIIDDYAHHPEEIKVVLKMGRLACQGKVIVVMQPHRYSRLADLYSDFCKCFDNLDHLIIAPIYSAGEPVRPQLTHHRLAQDIQVMGVPSVQTIDHPDELPELIHRLAQSGDIVLCLGAGNITYWARDLPQSLQKIEAIWDQDLFNSGKVNTL